MSVFEYFSRSIRILDYKIHEDRDEAIMWIDGIRNQGIDLEIDENKRQDVFIIPVAYIDEFFLNKCDGNEFFEKLLERADFSKEYMYSLWEVHETEEELIHKAWIENRYAKYEDFGLYDFICAYCGKDLQDEYSELDHVIPKSRGGANSPENYVVSCVNCNRTKRNKTPEEANMPIRYGDCNLLREGGL